MKNLGLREIERFPYLNKDTVLPLEINVWHKFFGYHSILVVEREKRTKLFRVTNFNHVASMSGWIFQEDLFHYTVQNPNLDEPRWICRTIGRINEKSKSRPTQISSSHSI